jgi:hypothetical protein
MFNYIDKIRPENDDPLMKLRNRFEIMTITEQPVIIPGVFSKKNVKPRLHALIL